MTTDMMNLRDLVEKTPDADLLRKMVDPCGRRFAAGRLMEPKVGAVTARPVARRTRPVGRSATAIVTRIGRRAPGRLSSAFRKVRRGGRIVPVAVIIAIGVNTDGRREVLGLATGTSEAAPIWTGFLRKLARRGLRGVKPVISDAHERASRLRCPSFFAPPGSAAASTSSAMPLPMPARTGGASSRPSSPPPSRRTRQQPPAPNGALSPTRSGPRCPSSPC